MAQTNKQTDRHTDIATWRLNQPSGPMQQKLFKIPGITLRACSQSRFINGFTKLE